MFDNVIVGAGVGVAGNDECYVTLYSRGYTLNAVCSTVRDALF